MDKEEVKKYCQDIQNYIAKTKLNKQNYGACYNETVAKPLLQQPHNIKDYFFFCVENISYSFGNLPDYKKVKIERLERLANKTKENERSGYMKGTHFLNKHYSSNLSTNSVS